MLKKRYLGKVLPRLSLLSYQAGCVPDNIAREIAMLMLAAPRKRTSAVRAAPATGFRAN